MAAILVLAGCSLATSTPTAAPSRADPAAGASTRGTQANPAPPPRTTPRATLSDLMGAVPDRIDGFLGQPEIVRREGAGELRLYRSAACVVHVFLYPRNGTLSASHIEARSAAERLDAAGTDSCIASFS